MNYKPIATIIALSLSVSVYAQRDTLSKQIDSVRATETPSEKSNIDINPSAYTDSTRFTFRNYFILLGNEFKHQVTYPFHLKKKDWAKVAVYGGLTVGLSFVDKPVSKFFSGLADRNKPVSSVSHFMTNFGGPYEVLTLAAFTTYGFIADNEKIKSTAFLASQAYISAGLMETIIKYLTNRQRPNYITPQTNLANPTFHGPFFKFSKEASGTGNSSFPSGHTSLVFAAATVYAMEYRHHPWIPIFSYGFASLVGITRLTENKHWPTDVLAGAAIGILCGKNVVYTYHRFMKIKQPQRPGKVRGSMSFSLTPFYGQLLPGVKYNF